MQPGQPPAPIMRRALRRYVGWVVGAVLGLAAVGLAWMLAPPPAGVPVELEIPRGATLRSIAAELRAERLIRSPTAFMVLARLRGAERGLKAGTYALPRGVTPWQILDLLLEGVIELNHVTVPEGLTMWETAGLLEREAAVDSIAFMELATDSLTIAALGVPSSTLEGYLFPETYDVPVGQAPRLLIERMVARTLGILESAIEDAPESELSRPEVITLASIVEAEARVPEERARIAAVYLNRLRRGWRLEADPTVLYALGERRPRLYYKDLEIDSPWNTYRVMGLPPTPICNPGRGAIRAVLNPEPDCDDMFFVAQDDGRHRFSRTQAEHERAKREIRSARERGGR